jgi:UDP-N-acetyl-D-mannosaminuronate dehydrogenase
MSRKSDNSENKLEPTDILVVGLGEVGSAIAAILDQQGPVLRHDIEYVPITAPIAIMHLCIPFQSQTQFRTAAISYIKRFMPRLTIIHSTVLPGTTRMIAESSRAAVVYSPVRGKHIRMEEDLLHYVKFVASPRATDAESAEVHLQESGMKTRRIECVETLELAKLAETTYFGVCIAFAQELNRYADQVGANYGEAVEFFDEVKFLPRERYYPGFIGGHCVMPNINLLLQIAPSPFLEAIVDSNERRADELYSESKTLGEIAPEFEKMVKTKMLLDR